MEILKDILMDVTTKDLPLSAGSFTIRQGREAVAQRLLIKFGMHQGEWFLDRSFGIPYKEDVLVRNPSLAVIDALFREALLSTGEVLSLRSYNSSVEASTRTLTVSFVALTKQGEVAGVVSVGAGTDTAVSEEDSTGFPPYLFILSFTSPESIME